MVKATDFFACLASGNSRALLDQGSSKDLAMTPRAQMLVWPRPPRGSGAQCHMYWTRFVDTRPLQQTPLHQTTRPCARQHIAKTDRQVGQTAQPLHQTTRPCARQHIAKTDRQVGQTAQVEQNSQIEGQTQEDGTPAPGRDSCSEQIFISLNRPNANFSEKNRPSAGHMDRNTGLTYSNSSMQ